MYRLIFLLGMIGSGCASEPPKKFLALGHIYRWDDTNDRMDPRIDALDVSGYDGIWLLGDLTGRTSERASTLDYIDQKFDLASPSTHWSLGNHDLIEGDSARIVARTQRPTFHYVPAAAEGLNVLVLNTNLFVWPRSEVPAVRCTQLERQFDLLNEVTALQQPGEQLVVLHHHALLPQARADTFPTLNLVWNFYHPEFWTTCDSARTFEQHYLPLLDEIRSKGVDVTFIGGDIGQRAKRFTHRDEQGILWLGTGINNSMDPRFPPPYVTDFGADHILELTYHPQERRLDHRFIKLNERVEVPAR